MRNARLIATNAVLDLYHRHVLTMLALLLLLTVGVSILGLRNAGVVPAGGELLPADKTLVLDISRGMYYWWWCCGWLIAVMGSALVIASDLKNHVALPVLAKPISRWEYLAGKWLGVEAVMVFFMLAFFGLTTGLLFLYGLPPTGFYVVLSMLQVVANLTLLNSLALALMLCFKPFLAGGSLVVMTLVWMQSDAWCSPDGPFLGWCLKSAWFWLSPARMPRDSDFFEVAIGRVQPPADLGLCMQILTENLLYAGGVLLVGSIAFKSHDVTR